MQLYRWKGKSLLFQRGCE